MKISITLLVLTSLALPSVFAEEKSLTPAAPPEKPLQLAPEPAPMDILIPEALPPSTKPRGSAIAEPSSSRTTAPRVSKTQIAEDEVKQRIQYRLAKNKAVRDPAVQAAWDEAERAKTEFDKREAMKRYYTLLNARIRKIDGSLSKVAVERQTYATRRLDQTRIDPTEPLNPDERGERQGRN
jgi:hypothetical protein